MAPALSPALVKEESKGELQEDIQTMWADIVTLEGSPPNAPIYF